MQDKAVTPSAKDALMLGIAGQFGRLLRMVNNPALGIDYRSAILLTILIEYHYQFEEEAEEKDAVYDGWFSLRHDWIMRQCRMSEAEQQESLKQLAAAEIIEIGTRRRSQERAVRVNMEVVTTAILKQRMP